MTKISAYSENVSPGVNDFVVGNDTTPTTKKTRLQSLINLFFNNIPASSVGAPAMLGIDMYAIGSSISASPPTAGTGQFYIQASTSIVTTDASGFAHVPFPVSFPNGLLSFTQTQGDFTGGHTTSAASNGDASGFDVGFGSGVPSTVVRINWIAIGF